MSNLLPAEIRESAERAAASGESEEANPHCITAHPYLNGLWYGLYWEAVEKLTQNNE